MYRPNIMLWLYYENEEKRGFMTKRKNKIRIKISYYAKYEGNVYN